MRELNVRLEPQAEPRCGFTHAMVYTMRQTEGGCALDDVIYGLIFPQAAEMALRAPINPLELALRVWRELQFAPVGTVLRYWLVLDRRNTAIIERDKKRARDAKRPRARGTRSTRSHGKKRAGR